MRAASSGVATNFPASPEQLHRAVVPVHTFVVAVPCHLYAGRDQCDTEHEQQPPEAADQCGAGEDEHRAQRQCPEDAPEEHSVLVTHGDGKRREDHGPDEHVVDAERLLDHVATHVFAERGAAEQRQDDDGEAETEGHPHCRLDQRTPGRGFVVVAVQEQVDREHRDDQGQQAGPVPRLDVELGELRSDGRYEREGRFHGRPSFG